MPPNRVQEVFTPGSFPALTYVARENARIEQSLRETLTIPGQIISLIGPSKSGKTVLVQNVVGDDNLIPVSGATIRESGELWSKTLDWMNLPSSTTDVSEIERSLSADVEAGGGIQLPLIAHGETSITGGVSTTRGQSTQETRRRGGLEQVTREIADSDFVVLLDDFHYVDRRLQERIAQECKEAARLEVKICVVSVPHRADDVIRANPDLRGRVASIDLTYWPLEPLVQVAEIGFPILNMGVDASVIERFAIESAGSPQLMQAICLQTCFKLDVSQTLAQFEQFPIDDSMIEEIFRRTSTFTNFTSLLQVLRRGPKERGVERLSYSLATGETGDVYECILKALKQDPPGLHFAYDQLKDRVEHLCINEAPRGVQIVNSVVKMDELAKSQMPRERTIDWDEERQVLDIVDPYFLFYLRWSGEI